MDKYKIAVHPGYVTSKYDGDYHFISFDKLCELYGLDSKKCIFWDDNNHIKNIGKIKDNYYHLYPLINGKYKEVSNELKYKISNNIV